MKALSNKSAFLSFYFPIFLNIYLNINLNMAVKTLTIKKDVYEELLKLKRKKESFSNLLSRLARNANSIEVLEAIRGKVEWKNKDGLIEEIYAKRFERR
jgi:predicted CopG family antitoxin